jgi:acetolactate synthase I/II/III large subunit
MPTVWASDVARRPATGAEGVLMGLRRAGVDYIFANAGTDFPPIIEAFSAIEPGLVPQPVTVPHETAGVGMAHGHYLLSGRPQAAMVHVNVGLANSVMGVINAASDNIPVIVLSGRTPLTEGSRPGGRVTPIQYGQEMYDQSSLVADLVKFHYEMRYPEQGDMLAMRACCLAMSEPRGPAYVSLPREPLMEPVPESALPVPFQVPTSRAAPDPASIALAAEWLSGARSPLILCQRGDTAGRVGSALARLAETHAIAVVEPFTIRNVMPSAHPMFVGHVPLEALAEADVVLVVDSAVPWMEALHRPGDDTRVIHLGPDPHFQRMPVRSYRCDLAITCEAALGVEAVLSEMGKPAAADARRATITQRAAARRETMAEAALRGNGSPMGAEWISRCISEVMDERAVVFSELGVVPGAMDVARPNQIFCNPHSGGLGWGMTAALGAQLADRQRLVIACIGDGSYIFANPVACHQIAEALELPILTIVKNNGMWNAVRRSVVGAYPDGAAARANMMPLTSLEPAPDYTQIAAASRAHVERVEHGEDLPAALRRAVEVIRRERRQVLLELRVAVSDRN